MTTDEAVAQWMRTTAFQTRYTDFWGEFEARLSTGEPLSLEEIDAAIHRMAHMLCLPLDIASGLFKRELLPERYAEFQGRMLQ